MFHPIEDCEHPPLYFPGTGIASQEIAIAISCEAMPVPGKYRGGCSQSSIGWNIGPPMKELEKVPKEQKGSATYRRNNNTN